MKTRRRHILSFRPSSVGVVVVGRRSSTRCSPVMKRRQRSLRLSTSSKVIFTPTLSSSLSLSSLSLSLSLSLTVLRRNILSLSVPSDDDDVTGYNSDWSSVRVKKDDARSDGVGFYYWVLPQDDVERPSQCTSTKWLSYGWRVALKVLR